MSMDQNDAARSCLACGYNLTGLGESPRCPECGLLNIPEGYRRQVWEFIDRRPWFISSFLNPFAQRLPGWWWALDRDGDVKRAARFAVWHLCLAICLVFLASLMASSRPVKVTSLGNYYPKYFDDGNGGRLILAPEHVGAMMKNLVGPPYIFAANDYFIGAFMETDERVMRVDWRPEFDEWRWWYVGDGYTPCWKLSIASAIWITIPCCLFIFLVWFWPAAAGLATQLRKGLPDFAKPPRTIITAALYEAHRSTYVAVLLALGLGLEVAIRSTYQPTSTWLWMYGLSLVATTIVLVIFSALGWVGPVRSDYTRQLIRGPVHATRIVVVYAAILPLAFTAACTSSGYVLYNYWIG